MIDLAALVYADLDALALESLARQAQTLTRQRFGRVMQLYAPLYLSNECVNTCSYCGYSISNRIPRRTLTPTEVRQEAQALSQDGLRHILLVAGEHPTKISVNYMADCVAAIRDLFASISIEVAPLDEAEYRQLTAAGISGLTLYQETYNREIYASTHLAGPKTDYDERLSRVLDGARAGMRVLGLGCLWGLAPWQEDFLALIKHAREVQREAWSSQIALSFPRLRDAQGVGAPTYPVSDRDLVKMIILARLALPEAHLTLSTREPASLRDAIAPLGITMMSAGSRTNPGAYSLEAESLEQFDIEDHRSIAEVRAALDKLGFEATTCDWHPALHGALI